MQTNLTYRAIEFGRRARMPNRTADVLRHAFGDCKDHALLLWQMLVAVDLPAQLALVNSAAPIRAALPSLDQFNHIIVFVPGQRDGWFLDATDKGADLMRFSPPRLDAEQALVLDERNPRLVTMPLYPTDAIAIMVQRSVHLRSESDATVNEVVTLDGAHAAQWRRLLLPLAPTHQRQLLQSQFGDRVTDITDVKIESLEDPTRPLTLSFSYTLKHHFHRENDQVTATLPMGFDRSVLVVESLDQRLTPFEFLAPFRYRSFVSVVAPTGFLAERPTPVNPVLDPRFGVCELRTGLTGPATITRECDYLRPAGRFPPQDYEAYRKSMGQLMSTLERPVAFRGAGRG